MIKTLIATAMFALGAVAATASPDPVREKLDLICEVRGYECNDLAVPAVKDVTWRDRAWGIRGKYRLFMEPDAVYVDSQLGDRQWQVTLVHELAHYVDYQLGYAPVSEKMWNERKGLYLEYLCASEGRAWHMGNTYAILQGWDDLQDYTWVHRYEHCEVRHLK